MFERYTEKARRSIFFARYEASTFGSPEIGTEHLLLGLLREDPALLGAKPPLEPIRKWIVDHGGARGETIPTSMDLPLNQECKRALMLGADEATKMGHTRVETGHLLLGIVDQESCGGATALREFGFIADALRAAVASNPVGAALPDFPAASRADSPGGHLQKALLDKAGAHWGSASALWSSENREARNMYLSAQGEARKLNSPCVETRHLLLALVQGIAVKTCFGLDPAAFRQHIKPEPARREHVSAMPPTDELKRALAFAAEEAERLGHKDLGPEHLVLGLLREEASEASEILRANGLSLDQARRAVAAFRDPRLESEGSDYV
ncbi:MAG: hypothetical protein JO307_31780 [Bryobacterales bacterium]|nr:hypothetical protein [Bryobacterales bacterium]MBV9401681.1 hypothetical protein [Bryobacterales bacterium]